MKIKKINEGLLVYQDVATGKQYVWNGSNYIDFAPEDQNDGQPLDDKNDENGDRGGDKPNDQPKGGKGGKGKPQIGDQGDQNIQDLEDLARAATETAEKAEDEGDQELADKLNDLAEQAKKAAEEASENNDDLRDKINDTISKNGGRPKDITLDNRIAKIKEILRDKEVGQAIRDESTRQILKHKNKVDAAKADIYKASPMVKIRTSLTGFLRNETATSRDASWKRFNKKYASSGLIKPGIARNDNKHIPLINVYFDRSGSWDDAKTADGYKVIQTLNDFVRQGKIKINLYYFSNNVHTSKEAAENEGGTEGQPIMDHINKTGPDNVIIMTDSDISDINSGAVVPGGVWLIFKGGISPNLINNIKGKKLTKMFSLDS